MTTGDDETSDRIFRSEELRAVAVDAYKKTFFPNPRVPGPVDRTKCLYHYTSSAGLMGILQNKVLWATDTAFLNDSEEIGFAAEPLVQRMFGHFLDVIRPHTEDGHIPLTADDVIDTEKIDLSFLPMKLGTRRFNQMAVLNCAREIIKYYACNFRKDVVEMNYSYIDGATYVSCLSEAHDDLGQWRGYGQGGYAIGFSREHLATAAPALRPVKYGGQAIDDLCSRVLRHFDNREPGSAEDLSRDGYVEAVSFCMPQIALIKHEAFAQEREWRLVVPRYSADYTDVKVRPLGQRVVPYLECEFGPGAVAEIVIGPGGDLHSLRAVRALLDTCGYNTEEVAISHSTAPFKG